VECPIKNLAFETANYKGKHATRECIQELCAWWNNDFKLCSIKLIAYEILPKKGEK